MRVGLHSPHLLSLLGSMACTLIGGTAVGTVLTLVFPPALYSIWFAVRPTAVESDEAQPVLAHS